MPLGSSSSSSNGVNVSGSRLSSKNLSRQGGEDGAIDIAKAFDMSSFEDMDPSTCKNLLPPFLEKIAELYPFVLLGS
jgi:hypothetical protein